MDYFRDKRVLITGGSSGIGLAAAELLQQRGASLVLVARDQARLEQARSKLGGAAEVIPLDVGDREAVQAALADLSGPPVDMLINNAGVTLPGDFLELPAEEFERQMRINYLGSVWTTRALLPAMIDRGSGHVAFVSSLLGLMGIYGYTAYAPSKFAMRGFAECLRCEVKPAGVRVTVCYPPDTDTPQHAFEKAYLPEETKAIAGSAGELSAEAVAEALLKGMARGCFHVTPGLSARFADVMYRLLPGFVRGLFDSDVKKVRSRRA